MDESTSLPAGSCDSRRKVRRNRSNVQVRPECCPGVRRSAVTPGPIEWDGSRDLTPCAPHARKRCQIGPPPPSLSKPYVAVNGAAQDPGRRGLRERVGGWSRGNATVGSSVTQPVVRRRRERAESLGKDKVISERSDLPIRGLQNAMTPVTVVGESEREERRQQLNR